MSLQNPGSRLDSDARALITAALIEIEIELKMAGLPIQSVVFFFFLYLKHTDVLCWNWYDFVPACVAGYFVCLDINLYISQFNGIQPIYLQPSMGLDLIKMNVWRRRRGGGVFSACRKRDVFYLSKNPTCPNNKLIYFK